MSDKTKDFTDYIKQDFDVVEDYKASKEITPKELKQKVLDCQIEFIVKRGHIVYRNELSQSDLFEISQAIDKLETLEKRDTPMKVINRKDLILGECPNCGGGLTRTYHVNNCGYCPQKLDWSGPNE